MSDPVPDPRPIICVDLNGVLAAHVFVDDRAVCFRGNYGGTLEQIAGFKAHWE